MASARQTVSVAHNTASNRARECQNRPLNAFDARPTRGHGLLEGYLARRRAEMAVGLLPWDRDISAGVLDIGCGTGEKTPLMSALCQTGRNYGRYKGIRENWKRIRHEVHVDWSAVTALAVIEHLEVDDVRALFVEARRVLIRDGALIVTTPAPWTWSLLKVMARVGLVSRDEINEHKQHFTIGAVRQLMYDPRFERGTAGRFGLGTNQWIRGERLK